MSTPLTQGHFNSPKDLRDDGGHWRPDPFRQRRRPETDTNSTSTNTIKVVYSDDRRENTDEKVPEVVRVVGSSEVRTSTGTGVYGRT